MMTVDTSAARQRLSGVCDADGISRPLGEKQTCRQAEESLGTNDCSDCNALLVLADIQRLPLENVCT